MTVGLRGGLALSPGCSQGGRLSSSSHDGHLARHIAAPSLVSTPAGIQGGFKSSAPSRCVTQTCRVTPSDAPCVVCSRAGPGAPPAEWDGWGCGHAASRGPGARRPGRRRTGCAWEVLPTPPAGRRGICSRGPGSTREPERRSKAPGGRVLTGEQADNGRGPGTRKPCPSQRLPRRPTAPAALQPGPPLRESPRRLYSGPPGSPAAKPGDPTGLGEGPGAARAHTRPL